jgi:2-dehydropantoate 2-reductase
VYACRFQLNIATRPTALCPKDVMRILVVGAGAVGGYVAGRLLEAGRDVTLLVRPQRAEQLAKTGLVIRSSRGDVHLPAPPTIIADGLRQPFDLIVVSCKAYDLAAAMDSFAPAVAAHTTILPLLNGMRHLDVLGERFGRGAVLGGQTLIASARDADGRILHVNASDHTTFGELDGSTRERTEAIAAALAGTRLDMHPSPNILGDMWEKWAFVAFGAGINCLMRGTFGDIASAGAGNYAIALFDECCAIIRAHGYAPSAARVEQVRAMSKATESPLMASMARDIDRGAPIEADHIVGDLIRRGEAQKCESPLLRIVDAHLKTYEARRMRERNASPA